MAEPREIRGRIRTPDECEAVVQAIRSVLIHDGRSWVGHEDEMLREIEARVEAYTAHRLQVGAVTFDVLPGDLPARQLRNLAALLRVLADQLERGQHPAASRLILDIPS